MNWQHQPSVCNFANFCSFMLSNYQKPLAISSHIYNAVPLSLLNKNTFVLNLWCPKLLLRRLFVCLSNVYCGKKKVVIY